MNPYTVEQSPWTQWCAVVTPGGRVVAHCPTKQVADEVAAALWESQKRLQDGGGVEPEHTLGGEG